MTTKHYQIKISGIIVEIERKDIKNLHVGVYPPNGFVRVAAPLRFGDEAVRLALISRLRWIRQQQEGFLKQDRQSQREMVSGESHYFHGRRYRLDVIEHDALPSVRLANNSTMVLQVRPGSSPGKRESVLHAWYRQWLRQAILPLLAKWQPKVGVEVAELRIKKMKTRWGSCNPAARRIWINLELAKKPVPCLEYILVHEMIHILERNHNDRFKTLMDKLMPSWHLRREDLNRVPLAHEKWKY